MNIDPVLVICPHDGVANRIPAERLSDGPRCGRCHQTLFSGKPIDLSARDFDRHLMPGHLPLLVDFWAPWCGPCRTMAPAFAAAAGMLEPGLRLGKVDTESETSLAARFGIRSIPTLILFAQGRELARQSGALNKAEQIARWAASNFTP